MRVAVACFSPYLGGMELDAIKYFHLFSSLAPTFLLVKKNSLLSKELENEKSINKNRNVIEFDFSSNWSPFFAYNLRKEILKHSVDVIVFFGASELKAIAPAIHGLDVKLIMRHGTTKQDSKKDWFHEKLYQYVDAHVPISQHLASNVQKIFPLKVGQNPKMIYNLVSCDEHSIQESFESKNNFLNDPNGILEILHVGRIVEGKGQLEALKAAKALKETGLVFKLTFVGPTTDDAYYQTLLHYVKDNHLTHEVAFVGYHKDVLPFYQKSHLFLFPSHGEGLPNVVLEALAHGMPVLSFENTIFPELRLLGLSVHLAKDKDQHCLDIKLTSMAQSIKSRLRNAMDSNLPIIEKYFSKESVLNEWLRLFFSLDGKKAIAPQELS